MLLISLLLHFFALLDITCSYAIPIRRIRLPTHSSERVLAIRQQPSSTSDSVSFALTTLDKLASSSTTVSGSPTSSTMSPGPTSSVPTSPSQSDGSRKYVVAHHMVGNTFPYTPQDWTDDIVLAHASGIDGFALNMGRDDWQPSRVSDAYDAVLQSGLDFKLFLSLDMSSFPCGSASDAQTLRNLVIAHASHPNQLLYDSRAFVSTFSGESCTFGQSSAPDGWKNEFAGHPDLLGKIYFVPAFFIDPTKFGDFRDVMDGDFNWNSGWPIHVTTDFVKGIINSNSLTKPAPASKKLFSFLSTTVNNIIPTIDIASARVQSALSNIIGSIDSDANHLDNLAALSTGILARDTDTKPAYMTAVSPWFFTHYSPETFNKNFVFLSDQHLYLKRWENLVSFRDKLDIVQILTWNDYGESHYIGPIKGAQPNSEAWVDGMEHTAWLELTEYYATAFKSGNYPVIEKDKLFMWSRTHPTQATAPDPVGPPANFELFEDAVWVAVMAKEPSTVVLSTSPSNAQTFKVPAGLTKLSISITAGGTMKGTIERDGRTVVTLNPPEFTFQGNPKIYNFNAFVASATAD